MKDIIDRLIEKLGDTRISYSFAMYAVALCINKGLITEEELVNCIKEVESQIKDEYLTKEKTQEELEDIKQLVEKQLDLKVVQIESKFVEQVKEFYLGIVFSNDTYITIKSYEDISKIEEELEKIKEQREK